MSETISLRSLLSLAWPIVIARATQSVIGFCDALMVAPLGEEPLAAATTGSLNTFAAIIFPMGTVFILQGFAAQLRGRGELEAVRRYAWYGLIFAALSAVVAALAIPFMPWLLSHLSYAPRVHGLMSSYMAIRLLSVGAVVGTEALSNWYGGLGNTRLGMIAGVVAMVANVAGCYLLIEPRFGLPGFGIAGAAWAAVGASFLGFLVVGGAFVLGLGVPRSKGSTELKLAEFSRMLRFGLPNGINWFLEFGAFVMFINVVVGHLGTTALAAFNVVMQINSLSFMPAFGISSAGAILVGEAIGRRLHEEVWPILKLTMSVACVWMVSVGVIYLLAPTALIGMFLPRDMPAVNLLHVGVTMLSLASVWQLFDAVNMTVSEALRAAGDTTWSMWARVLLAWAVFTPLAWTAVLVFHGGVLTVMIALILYLAALAATLVLRFMSGRWRQIDMIGSAPDLV